MDNAPGIEPSKVLRRSYEKGEEKRADQALRAFEIFADWHSLEMKEQEIADARRCTRRTVGEAIKKVEELTDWPARAGLRPGVKGK